MKKDKDYFDLASISTIIILAIFSLIRFPYLPQYVDDYYHISTACWFSKIGGWNGWNFWDYAPWGRPQVYPPLYHFLLVLLKKIGFSWLNAVRFAESVIPVFFFFFVWKVIRSFNSNLFSFIFLLALSSFFSFFSSLSANIPATLALIFGFLSWLFLMKKKPLSASIFLTLSFYTHAGIPWIFTISLLFLLFIKKERPLSLRIIALTFLGSFPLLFHQLRHLHFIHFEILREVYFTHLSIFVIISALVSLFFIKRDRRTFLFLGFLFGSLIIFFKYPYRLFSAQGIIGFVFFSSLLLERIFIIIEKKKKIIFISLIFLYFFFFHSTLDYEVTQFKFNFLNSTYINYLRGKPFVLFEFRSLFWPQYYYPIVRAIQSHTKECEIISSNLNLTAQIFSALAERPTSRSILGEVRPKKADYFRFAKVIIWMKSEKLPFFILKKLNWKKIYENEIAYVFINPAIFYCVNFPKAKISFWIIVFIFFLLIFLLIRDNIKISKN